MLERLLLVLVTVLSVCLPAGARPLAEVLRGGEVVIGTDATYPPFEVVTEGGKYEGFDIDLGEAIARDLGVRARWINAAFDGIFVALQTGKYDLVMSTVIITSDRQKAMAMSDPYYDAGQVVAVHKGKKRLSSSQLPGHEVGVQINTTAQFALEKVPGIVVRKYPDIATAMLDLQNDRLDAVVNDLPTTRYMIRQTYQDLEIVGEPFTRDHYGICVRLQDTDLLAAINGALAKIKASGEYNRIQQRWFGSELAARGSTAQGSSAPDSNAPAANDPGATAQDATDAGKPAPTRIDAQGHLKRFFSAIPNLLLTGALWTLGLTGLALAFGIPIGLIVGLGRIVPSRPINAAFAFFVEATRGTPLLVQIFTIYFVLPAIGIRLPAFPAAVIALSLNAGAYISEIFRAGIQSIHKGQLEAAFSLGYTWLDAMLDVIIPQALRRIVPPLSNEAISLLKDSSLVMVIGMTELTRRGQELSSVLGDPLAIWPAVGVCYLFMTLPLTGLARYLEHRWAY